MSTDIQRLKQLLAEALALSAAERKAFVEQSCAGDAGLRAELERLIKAHESAGDFLEQSAVPPESDLRIETCGSFIGRYKLLQEIGEGAFGRVFVAEQTEPVQRRVALKIVKAGMDTKEVIARFEAERQALALMDHPNIARVLDGGATEAGRPYFVMELVRGISITEYCDRNNLPMAERLELFMQVCQAVQHAHQKAIIHRDLKPTNILVTMIDGKPVPKIIDFGVAKALGHKLTERTLFTAFEQIIGTPAYMSPEQAALSGVDVDTRSDIYSLGVLLYELLTGVTPFDGETLRKVALDEIWRMIRETEPPKPSTRLQALVAADVRKLKKTGDRQLTEEEVRASSRRLLQVKETIRLVHGDLDWIVMRALEKDRRRRYETAAALAEDLQRHLDHHPVQASPPGTLYRARKFVRRHRMGVALAASVALALIVGLIASLAGFAQARHQRNRAVMAEEQAFQERDHAITAERQTEQERNHAELLAAEAALAIGQSKLESGDSWGLFDMVKAYGLAKHNIGFQQVVGRRWSTWQAYWDRLTIAVRPMHGTPSPDYLQFASVVWDSHWRPENTSGVVYLYDTLTRARVVELKHDSAVLNCGFSVDGRLFATLTEEGVVHLWDRKSGIPLRRPCPTGITGLTALAFSPDTRLLAAFPKAALGSSSKVALLRLDKTNGPPSLLDHPYPVNDVRFSPDGGLLAVACKPCLQLWRISDLRPAGLPVATSFNVLLEFSPDGKRLAFNPQSSGIGLLDTTTRQTLRILPNAFQGHAAAFTHDGRLLASFDWDCNIEFWDTESGTKSCPAQDVSERMFGGFAFNRDDTLLAAGDAIGMVRVLRVRDGQIVHALHVPPFAEAAFLTNGVLASRASDLGYFWDLSAMPLSDTALLDDALASALAFDSSGEFLAVGGKDRLRLWAFRPSPTLERVVRLPGVVVALTFAREDRQFVAFTDDGSITLVEPRTGNKTTRSNCGRGYGLEASLSPDGRKLALFRYLELNFVNAGAGECRSLDPEYGTLAVAFSRDSKAMAMGSADWYVKSYDITSETNAISGATWKFDDWVEGLAFHPSGDLLAVNIGHRNLHLYDCERRCDIGSVRKSSVSANLMQFSDDGSLLAVAGPAPDGGHAVELWHVDPERGLFASGLLLRHDLPIWSLTFSPDNRTLVVGGVGTTRLWHLPPLPKDSREIETRTWATLGFHMDERGQRVYFESPRDTADEIRARLTQKRVSSVPPLDEVLKQPPVEALAGLQRMADQHPDVRVYGELLARLHATLAMTAAGHGSWAEAQAHGDEAIRLGYDGPNIRYQHALFCLGAGYVAGYRATCQAMAERYRSAVDPAVIKCVAWAAALAPGALDDYTNLIERLRRAAPRVGGPHGPAYRFYLGAALARSGRWEEAVAELEQVRGHLEAEGAFVDFSPTYLKFLQAICHAHLGHKAEARRYFDAASTDTQNSLRQQQGDSPSARTISWNRKLTLQLLQEEARSLLNSTPPAASSR